MNFYITRYKDIEEKEYSIEVVTPMFLGGADQEKAEFRVPSLKGVLRFWWRALYGKKYPTIKEMNKNESVIFGDTKRKASFSIIIKSDIKGSFTGNDLPKGKKFEVFSKSLNKKFNLSIIDYLAYGLFEYDKGKRKNVYRREHINPNNVFTVSIFYYSKKYVDEIENSLKALINYGGLGSRSRNGFGSLNCEEFNDFEILSYFKGALKEFTATSSYSKLFRTKEPFSNWVDALSELGLIYKDARLKLENRHKFEKRGLVARPIEAKREKIPNNIKNGRHAKSYFLHVTKKNGRYVGQILFMPFQFYEPENKKRYMDIYSEMNDQIAKRMEEIK